MAKQKGQTSVANRHIYTRASYLYQAAQYLAKSARHDAGIQPSQEGVTASEKNDEGRAKSADAQEVQASGNLSRRMISDMRSMSLKAQIRHSPNIKGTICKLCNSLLIEGQTSKCTIENPSKGGKKPWADVLVVRCLTCGHAKRFPVCDRKQKRKDLREKRQTEACREHAAESSAPT